MPVQLYKNDEPDVSPAPLTETPTQPTIFMPLDASNPTPEVDLPIQLYAFTAAKKPTPLVEIPTLLD